MEFERCGIGEGDLVACAGLFAACFPGAGRLSNVNYLRWLYAENPAGAVVAFNAWEDDHLVAHYACVPVRVRLDGDTVQGLLSLNTATHPDYQGRGLFTRLADMTYAAGTAEGARLVYGVANANSTPGFVRKLGFTLVSPLQSRVGVGPLGRFDWTRVAAAPFRIEWSREQLAWRLRNPANPVRSVRTGGNSLGFEAASGRPLVRAFAQVPMPDAEGDVRARPWLGARVWLGLLPEGAGRFGAYPHLPARLRPSPLNLIVRGLSAPVALEAAGVSFSFLDFDAF